MTAYSAADYDYDCPPDLIAQHPPAVRGTSRLMVLDRTAATIAHQHFPDFPSLLDPGDCLVVNSSRVIPARLTALRDNGRPAELLLVHEEPDGTWQAMVHPGGKLKAGRTVRFGTGERQDVRTAGQPSAEIVEVLGSGLRRIRFHDATAHDIMARFGAVPLPPYIHRAPEDADRERYQTVYARAEGSVAAPTAGLHFTRDIMDAMRANGVAIAEVTLHVGPGTFKPLEVENPDQHVMHAEWYEMPEETAETIRATRAAGRRVWAVGTTACRVLETRGRVDTWTPGRVSGWTDLFIRPGVEFQVVDGLLTNFHLPRSTLLMLVAAFAGYDLAMRAYREAVQERYRLYSYGDAMAIR